ncbi:MAG TPA: protein YgfX [Herminiimonas sp.]|jgi:hypothetical protein|nr:protein YgfX [Herminiimonas sp.]
MSIAVSAVVMRSRCLTAVVAGMCICVMLAGCAIGLGAVGDLRALEKALIAGICMTIASYVFFRTVKTAKAGEIHVSGTGQIRLGTVPGSERIVGRTGAEYSANQHGEPVRLLPASTLWPWLMVLHFRHENGRISILTILPDAVGEESFRALLVACRWIVMRHAEDIR